MRFWAKRQVVDTGSPAGHVGRGPGAIRALWSVWRALKVFFPAGVDKTISLVSVREALFCTYVSVHAVCFLPQALMSCEHTAQTYTRYTTDNMHRSHRSNAAAHTPCVFDTPIRAVLLWLVVFVGTLRPHFIVSHIFFYPYVPRVTSNVPVHFFWVVARSTDHRLENNTHSSAHSVLTSSFLQHHNQPCCPAAAAAVGTSCAYG